MIILWTSFMDEKQEGLDSFSNKPKVIPKILKLYAR